MKTRKISALVLALMALALMATACNKAGSTPTATAKAFYEAAKNKDVAGMKSVLSKRMLDMMEKAAKARNKSVDDFIKESNDAEPPPANFETRNEKINGDTATLEVTNGKGGWEPFNFVKEDGQWKLTLPAGAGD
jgi:hypothetical protein